MIWYRLIPWSLTFILISLLLSFKAAGNRVCQDSLPPSWWRAFRSRCLPMKRPYMAQAAVPCHLLSPGFRSCCRRARRQRVWTNLSNRLRRVTVSPPPRLLRPCVTQRLYWFTRCPLPPLHPPHPLAPGLLSSLVPLRLSTAGRAARAAISTAYFQSPLPKTMVMVSELANPDVEVMWFDDTTWSVFDEEKNL